MGSVGRFAKIFALLVAGGLIGGGLASYYFVSQEVRAYYPYAICKSQLEDLKQKMARP